MKLSAILLAVLALAVTPFAQAHTDREVIIGGASVHINAPSSSDYDDFNPVVGLHYHDWEIAFQETSFEKFSVFVGYNHERPVLISMPDNFAVWCGVRTGVATGYPNTSSDLIAVIHPHCTAYSGGMGFEAGVRPTGWFDPGNEGSDAVLTAALRVKF